MTWLLKPFLFSKINQHSNGNNNDNAPHDKIAILIMYNVVREPHQSWFHKFRR